MAKKMLTLAEKRKDESVGKPVLARFPGTAPNYRAKRLPDKKSTKSSIFFSSLKVFAEHNLLHFDYSSPLSATRKRNLG
jgi:hypothetical protein